MLLFILNDVTKHQHYLRKNDLHCTFIVNVCMNSPSLFCACTVNSPLSTRVIFVILSKPPSNRKCGMLTALLVLDGADVPVSNSPSLYHVYTTTGGLDFTVKFSIFASPSMIFTVVGVLSGKLGTSVGNIYVLFNISKHLILLEIMGYRISLT